MVLSQRARLVLVVPVCMVLGVVYYGCGGRSSAGDWPHWRGPQGVGVSELGPLPTAWSGASANMRWRSELLGEGNSSPIVSRGRVIVTAAAGARDALERQVLAYDATSGELLWTTVVVSAPAEKLHAVNTSASATPATDGELVYVNFGSTLTALDFDGQVVWENEFDPTYFEFSRYGVGSSPLVAGDLVVVAQDRESQRKPTGWLAAFDKRTGEEVWRTEWDDSCCSYTTPFLVDRSPSEFLFAHSGRLAGYDIATGEELWHHEYPMLQPVATPVIDGDLLCASTGGHNKVGTMCIRLEGTREATQSETLWYTHKLPAKMGSPILFDGTFYVGTVKGILTAYDAETGEIRWQHRLPRGNYQGSMVAGDGKLYLWAIEGKTAVVAIDPTEYRELAANELGEDGTSASPAIGEGCLILRGESHLYCIEAESAAAQATGS